MFLTLVKSKGNYKVNQKIVGFIFFNLADNIFDIVAVITSVRGQCYINNHANEVCDHYNNNKKLYNGIFLKSILNIVSQRITHDHIMKHGI